LICSVFNLEVLFRFLFGSAKSNGRLRLTEIETKKENRTQRENPWFSLQSKALDNWSNNFGGEKQGGEK